MEKVHLTADELIGKSAVEYVDLPEAHYSDSSEIYFNSNHKYKRTPGMYVQTEGPYEVRNDTLEIHHLCHSPCDKTTCGIQRYVMRTDGKLYLTFMRHSDGTMEDLSVTPIDKVLEVR